jgi:hypothetical protein
MFGWVAMAGPGNKKFDKWNAPKNQKLLKQSWGLVTPVPPDQSGSEAAVRPAERDRSEEPFVLYIVGDPSSASRKIERNIFRSTAVLLATHACRVVRRSPKLAAGLPYLGDVGKIQDPMLVVVGADGTVYGSLSESRDFTAENCLALMELAVDRAFRIPLDRYVGEYTKLLVRAEKLWKQERTLEKDKGKIAKLSGNRWVKADKEFQEDRRAHAEAKQALLKDEKALRASLKLKTAARNPSESAEAARPKMK